MYIGVEMALSYVNTYCPLQDKDKHTDKDKFCDDPTYAIFLKS